MNEKLVKIIDTIKESSSAAMSPLLGPVCLGREKRLSVELTEEKIIICDLDPKRKVLKKIIEEDFVFYNKETKFEKDYLKFSEQISAIVKREKFQKREINLLIPSSDITIKSINMPLMSTDALSKQIQTPDFWAQFTDLPAEGIQEMLKGIALSYQILSKNKKEKMMEILFTYTDNNINEIKNQILKSSGLNPTVYEPKCLSLLNAIMLTQKVKEQDEFMLLVYGEEENYLIQRNKDKFIFTENKISRTDVTLLRQLEKLPDASGPFWDELYDRFFENIKPIIDEQLENPENKLDVLNIFTTFENNKNFLIGIGDKFPKLNINNLSTFPEDLNSLLTNKKDKKKNKNIDQETNEPINFFAQEKTIVRKNLNFFENKIFKTDKKLISLIENLFDTRNKYAFNIGSALRYLNPYSIKEPLNCIYKINLNVANHVIVNNRKISVTNSFLNLLTVATFLIVVAIVFQETPKYLENKKKISSYRQVVSAHDSLYAEINSLNAKKKELEKDKILINKILNRKEEYLDLIDQTVELVPEGVVLDTIDYTKGKHVMFQGKAASDLDIDLFLSNLREEMGEPELNSLGRTIIPINDSFSKTINNNGLNEFGEVQTPQPISENDEEVIPMEEVKTFEIKLNL